MKNSTFFVMICNIIRIGLYNNLYLQCRNDIIVHVICVRRDMAAQKCTGRYSKFTKTVEFSERLCYTVKSGLLLRANIFNYSGLTVRRSRTVSAPAEGADMVLDNFIHTLAQTSDIDQPTLFPFPFSMHLVFAIISLVFFVYRFVTDKRPYQLLLAIAIPFSLTIWISENRTLFYAIGLIELVLLIAALVTAIAIRKPESEPEADGEESDDEDDEDGDTEAADEAADEEPAPEKKKPAQGAPADEDEAAE